MLGSPQLLRHTQNENQNENASAAAEMDLPVRMDLL